MPTGLASSNPSLQTVFQALRAAEQAVPMDPRCLPWVLRELTKVDDERRQALSNVLTGGDLEQDKARDKLSEC